MMQPFNILGQNKDFFFATYNMGALVGVFFLLALADLALKGWAMWRAARMDKNIWFITLLVVNSFGILPVIFLLMTNDEYKKKYRK